MGGPPRGHPQHLRASRHPRGRAPAPRLRCRRAVRVRGRLPPDPRGPRSAGRHLHGHRHRAARAPRVLRGVLRHRHPGGRQQVRRAEHGRVVGRLVRLRAAGRARRDPAAGLLPHQHREHGPVRADADHRRRGLVRALHRGLHRPDLQERLAALGGRRDHREEERPRALHDDPELVEQRLQPRHQACDRPRGRHHGVDRRQHRLQGDDEVPVDLPDGRARQGRDALRRLRRSRPAPGRRRQDDPHGAVHAVVDRLEVDRPRRRPCRATAARCAWMPTRTTPPTPCAATPCWSTRSRAPTPIPPSTSASTTCSSATRPRSRRSARSSCSTCSPAACRRTRRWP